MEVLILVIPEEAAFYMTKHLPPLPVGILQSYLRDKGHGVQSFDLNQRFKKVIMNEPRQQWLALFDKEYFYALLEDEKYTKRLEKLALKVLDGINFTGIDFIGISTGSGISIFEVHFSMLLAKYIQNKYSIPVLFGGVNISHIFNFKDAFRELWNKFFEHFKYVIVGPGEVSFDALLNAHKLKTIDSVYYTLDGAIYKINNEIAANKESSPSFACPDFKSFDLSDYKSNLHPDKSEEICEHNFSWPFPYNIFTKDINNIKYKNTNYSEVFFSYYFNHHCPYNCAFCGQSSPIRTSMCSKNAESVLSDLKYLNKNFNAKYFHFVNNTFNYTPSFVTKVCNGIIEEELEIYWDDCARVNNLTKELLKLMYNSGCRKLVFGFETGSKKLQNYINKKLNIDLLKQVLVWCKEIGILCDLEVIIGFPYETETDFMDTYTFLDENKDLINYFYLNRYYVDPNSLMGLSPKDYNIELRTIQNYSIILNKNKELFKRQYQYDVQDIEYSNLHIFSFNEINGRKWETINKNINEQFSKIYNLQQSFDSISKAKKYLSIQHS